MKNLAKILAFSFIFGVSISASAMADKKVDNTSKTAQHNITVNIPSHALVGLSSKSTITLAPAAPTTAGEGLDFTATSASDNSLWLNYSSIKGASKSPRTISVNMTEANLPEGVTIEVLAKGDAGNGKGAIGTASETALELSTTSKDIIKNIGNCYTGTGSKAGHQLTYTLKMDNEANYEEIASGDYTTTIVYTITGD